jgi:HEAT repeat protein
VQSLEDLISDLTSGDDHRAEDAILPLSQMGVMAINALIDLLASSDPDHRWWAVRSLSTFHNHMVGDLLLKALSDSDPSVRLCAAISLRHAPNDQAIPKLIETMASNDRLFARLAGDALIAIDEDAIPALAEAIHSPNPATRGEAARALAKMKNPKTLPILYSISQDPSSIVQYWVEEGFELLGVGMVYFNP